MGRSHARRWEEGEEGAKERSSKDSTRWAYTDPEGSPARRGLQGVELRLAVEEER